jgi:hypothetical protein
MVRDVLSEVPLHAGVVYPIDNIKPKLVEEFFFQKTGCPLNRIECPRTALQLYYESLFPFSSTQLTAYDEYIIETTKLTLYLGNVRIDVSR